jgi:hypothetical protein
MPGPHTLIDRSIPLKDIVGKPTGQGFGAARKGHQLQVKQKMLLLMKTINRVNLLM